MAKRFLSLSASDIASFEPVELTDLPAGPADQVLTGQLEWQQVDPATMIKPPSGSWGGDMVISSRISLVPPDYEQQIDTGWSNNLNIGRVWANEFHALGTLHANSSTGTSGQVLSSTGTGVQWIDPPSTDIEPGPANSVLVTDPDGDQTEWSDKLEIETLKVNGDTGLDGELIVSGDAGLVGQVLSKTATGPEWRDIPVPPVVIPGSISPGDAHDVLVTGADGNVGWTNTITPTHLNVLGTLSLGSITGSAGQVMQQTATGEPEWTNLEVDVSQLSAGSTGQVLTTTAPNQAEWQNLPAFALSDIPPGSTPRQLLQTNVAGTAAEWTSNVVVPGTLTVHGNASLNGTLASINANLRLNNVAGSTGQFIKKTGSTTQAWSNIQASDVQPGLAYATLQTNATGTANVMTVEPRFPMLYVEDLLLPNRQNFTATGNVLVYLAGAGTPETMPGVSVQLTLARTGSLVTCYNSGFNRTTSWTAANGYRIAFSFPAGYRPYKASSTSRYPCFYVPVRINGGPIVFARYRTQDTAAGVFLSADADGGFFPATTTSLQVLPFTVTWITDNA